jgi:nitronate monooxygenase
VLLENPLCKLLSISYPIVQAGMAGQTTPELVAAVSNAGGLGILGATRMTPEKLLDAVRKIKMITTKPYGVNLWLGPQERKRIKIYPRYSNFWIRNFANHLVFR